MPIVLDPPQAEILPAFQQDAEGRISGVLLEPQAYAQLLLRANVLNPEAWPPEYREAAQLLARIDQIEARCIAAHGEWDFEALEPAQQDAYDSAVASLEALIEPAPALSFDACRAERQRRGLDV